MLRRLLLVAPAICVMGYQVFPAAESYENHESEGNRAQVRHNIAGLKTWESRMSELGRKWCDDRTYGFGWEQDVWFYDGARVYFQIADYTHDPSWNKCALHIAEQYKTYILSNGGKLPGWRVFPRRMRMAWERNAKRAQAAGYLIEDVRRIFVTGGYQLHQPFFDGLAAEALIDYYQLTKDPRVPPAIKWMLDGDWERAYDQKTHQTAYNPDPPGPTCSVGCQKYNAGLENLIAPAYAWYWRYSKDDVYRERGDEMFEHALDHDISYSGKIFSQNYRWSFDYVKWRSAG